MRFTDKYIKSIKAKDKPFVVTADSDARGVGRLQLKVYPSGNKKFQFQFFFEGKRKRMEIGAYGAWTLAAARKEAMHLSEILQQGKSPLATREFLKIEKLNVDSQRTLLELVADFFQFIEQKWAPNTVKRTTNSFKANLLPFISSKMMPNEFTPDVGRELIYKIYNRDAKQQAAIFKSDLMSLFKFAINFDKSPEQFKKPDFYCVEINPINEIQFDIPKSVGTRWLNEEEIHKLWNAPDLPLNTKRYYQLAIAFGGQRVLELYQCKDKEFNFNDDIFTIPTERIKVRKRGDHMVPISSLAKPIIQEMMVSRGKVGHLWPHRDRHDEAAHISTIRMATLRWCRKNKIPDFNPRDVRRTCKTLMGKAGISKADRDLLQQHNKADVSAIHYDRYDYMREKRNAMDIWTSYLVEHVLNQTSNNI